MVAMLAGRGKRQSHDSADQPNSSETMSEGRSGLHTTTQGASTADRGYPGSPSSKRQCTQPPSAASPAFARASGPAKDKDKDKGGRYNLSAAAAHLRPVIFNMNSTTPDPGALAHQPSSSTRDNSTPTYEQQLPRLQSRQDHSFVPSTEAWQPRDLDGSSPSASEPAVQLSSSELEALAKAQEILKAGLAPPLLLENLRSTIRKLELSLSQQSSAMAVNGGVNGGVSSDPHSSIEQRLASVLQARGLGETFALQELGRSTSLVRLCFLVLHALQRCNEHHSSQWLVVVASGFYIWLLRPFAICLLL
jgi:hypothetical protein